MPRPKGPDLEKIKKIRKVLLKNPNGLWIREIARKTSLDDSTISRYLAGYMKGEIKNTFPNVKGKLIKVVKLKRK